MRVDSRRPNSILIFTCVFLTVLISGNSITAHAISEPFKAGEIISYEIKKLGITAGEATLQFNGYVEVSNKKALSVTFTAKGFKFFDEEQIYLDAQTFHPLVIKRRLDIFGKQEKIIEFYDSERGKVRIVKTTKGKTTEQIIESGRQFDNIYGFIYRHRQLGRFELNEEFKLHLPTDDVTLKLLERQKIKAGGQEFDAYFMSSTPKKYKVWFDSGQNKIPLRIDGALGFGNMSMILKAPK